MNRTTFLLVTLVLCSMLLPFLGVDAQVKRGQKPLPPKEGQSQTPSNLDGFNDTSIRGFIIIDGSAARFGASDMVASRPDPNTVSFAGTAYMQASGSSKMAFALRYDPRQKNYLLTIKGEFGPSIENFPLSFSEGEGYAGKGTVKWEERELTTEATIKKGEKEGEYNWKIIFTDTNGSGRLEYDFMTARKVSSQ